MAVAGDRLVAHDSDRRARLTLSTSVSLGERCPTSVLPLGMDLPFSVWRAVWCGRGLGLRACSSVNPPAS
jgi:hypothetical protein